jgi:signal transduction histidine kinase
MRGELTVESTVGVGSRFTVELPRARHATAAST